MHRLSTCLLPLVLALPAFAQEGATTTASAGPVLILKTSEPDVAQSVAMMAFGYMDELPILPDSGHYELSLGADKQLRVASRAGEAGLADLTCDPGALMDVYAEEIEGSWPMARGAMVLAMQQSGMTSKQAFAFAEDLFAFPRQLAKLSLRLDGDPEVLADGMDIVLDVEGRAGSAFAGVVDKLAPSALGAPKLGGDAVMSFRVAVAPEGLVALTEPMRGWIQNFMGKDDATRQRAMKTIDAWMQLYDGTLSMSFGEGMRARMLMGVRDGDEARELMASEEYLEMARNQHVPGQDVEIEVTPDAVEHRGVKLMRSRITGLDESNPMMPDGTMETLIGAAGDWVVMTMGGGEAAAKALIDSVADEAVARAALPGGALLHVQVDVRAFLKMALEGTDMGGSPGEEVPHAVTTSMTRAGKTLRIATRIE